MPKKIIIESDSDSGYSSSDSDVSIKKIKGGRIIPKSQVIIGPKISGGTVGDMQIADLEGLIMGLLDRRETPSSVKNIDVGDLQHLEKINKIYQIKKNDISRALENTIKATKKRVKEGVKEVEESKPQERFKRIKRNGLVKLKAGSQEAKDYMASIRKNRKS